MYSLLFFIFNFIFNDCIFIALVIYYYNSYGFALSLTFKIAFNIIIIPFHYLHYFYIQYISLKLYVFIC